ncbi:hypothetical protein F0562_021966 [Nyssa sinensis]|uniref:Uncharacterized protein n=1 Tax=Nyssa sinensis TaxID=561372 RepID=A0A5J5BPZ7_9ASTE|nr:hypothetical protein F0562_021966 [Nyssa sinensis]
MLRGYESLYNKDPLAIQRITITERLVIAGEAEALPRPLVRVTLSWSRHFYIPPQVQEFGSSVHSDSGF